MARPKEFDPQEALQKAMGLFWAKGYHDTSIRDLVERTGVNYYGLYGAFASKHGLFLAALDLYRDTVTAELLRALRRAEPVREVIAQAFERLLELMRTEDGSVGCMMCNTAIELAPYETDAAAKVRAHRAQLQQAFHRLLAERKAAGELDETADADALAAFLTTTAYSLGLLLRAGGSDAEARRHVDTAMSLVR